MTSLYDQREAFFTLPEVTESRDLDKTLDNTISVDVWGLDPRTSLVYVPRDVVQNNALNSVRAKIKNGCKYPVSRRFVYTWDELLNDIDECDIGLRIVEDEETSSEFRTFRSRVDDMVEKDIDAIMERIEEVAQEQAQLEARPEINLDDFLGQTHNHLLRLVEQEKDTDLSTYRIGRSRHTLLGR